MSETRTFLLEIGFEEIPASYLEPAVSSLANELKISLFGLNIEVKDEDIEKMWTPRRITLVINNMLTSNPKLVVTQYGPPKKIAQDSDGNWTKAAMKFAQKLGLNPNDLYIANLERGDYVAGDVESGGEKTENILGLLLPATLMRTLFPKKMKWPLSDKSKGFTFARPVRWFCCFFGNNQIMIKKRNTPQVLSFADLEFTNETYGHRFAHPDAIPIKTPEEYVDKLRDAKVIVDPTERKEKIIEELTEAASELGAKLVPDDKLITEVTNLVEYPNVLACDLGGFMDLPREVLQTALAKHQRAFVVEKNGKLIPHFLVVTNAPKLDPELSRKWFERMAISRLEDADFFIKEDLGKGLEVLVEEESRVEWIGGIGSLADKTNWLTELGLQIGANIEKFNPDTYKRGAYLAKADLLSNLVREKEFTSLQGIAGAIYAERLNESPAVCTPIREQYTDTPSSAESAVLAIADRFLNICATFAIGKPPRGSSDPFALRRQAGAIFKILTDHKIHLDLPAVIRLALKLIGKEEKQKGQIAVFLRDRLELFCKDQGFAYDWVNAVLAVAAHDPCDAYLRLSAFSELDKGEEFRLVAVGQKRVANITKNMNNTPAPDTSQFSQKEEKELWNEAERIRPDVEAAVKSRDYTRALELLLSIRPAIDSFFDEVFVMVEDEKIKTNRLNLLNSVKQEFLKVADFPRIVVE